MNVLVNTETALQQSLDELLKQNPIRLVAQTSHPELFAYSAAMMPKHWVHAFCLKWNDDWSGANYLEYRLWIVASNIKHREKWRIPVGKEYLRKMAGLAIAELGDPKRFMPDESWQLKAAWIGASKTQWFDIWRARYELIYSELNDWTNRAYRWAMLSPARIRKHCEQKNAVRKFWDQPTPRKLPKAEPRVATKEPNWKALNRETLTLKNGSTITFKGDMEDA